MEKVIIEVGSTCTKVDLYDGEKVTRIGNYTIEFKRNYKKENKLEENDVKRLIDIVKELQEKYNNIYICGTSIFRSLTEMQRKEFLERFVNETNIEFDIIDPEKENVLTVLGATQKVNKRVAVFVGGGGSTEIAIYENEIKEMVNTPIGVMDAMAKFSDLGDDLATTDLEEVKKFVKENLQLPKQKADVLILAGGGHLFFALNSGVKYDKNTLYEDELAPIMMDINLRKQETIRYYKEISLDEIRKKVEDPNWWYATRAMCAFALVVAEEIGAKYIVPTDITMVYGLLDK